MHSNSNSSIRRARSVIFGFHFRVPFVVCRSNNWTATWLQQEKQWQTFQKITIFQFPTIRSLYSPKPLRTYGIYFGGIQTLKFKKISSLFDVIAIISIVVA